MSSMCRSSLWYAIGSPCGGGRLLIALLLILLLLATGGCGERTSFEGVGHSDIHPINGLILVRENNTGLSDDLCYLASIPFSTFTDQGSGEIHSMPLLFYSPPNDPDGPSVTDTYEAMIHLLDDWTDLSEEFRQIFLIGLNGTEAEQVDDAVRSNMTVRMDADPIALSSRLALDGWSRSSELVVVHLPKDMWEDAEIKRIEKDTTIPIDLGEGQTLEFYGNIEPGPVPPIFHDIVLGEDDIGIKATLRWNDSAGDPDLQIFSESIGQMGASCSWNVVEGKVESIEAYAPIKGNWSASITNMPTEGGEDDGWAVDYSLEVEIGKGDLIPVDLKPGRYQEITFEIDLVEDTDELVDIIIVGDKGEELTRTGIKSEGFIDLQDVTISDGFSIAISTMSGYKGDLEVTIEAERVVEDGKGWLMDAARGAVLGSIMNSPLLFVQSSDHHHLEEVINELDVEEVIVVDTADRKIASESFMTLLDGMDVTVRHVRETFTYEDLISDTLEIVSGKDENSTDSSTWADNGVVFTTSGPWTQWEVQTGIITAHDGSVQIGPAALAAAVRGSRLVFLESEPVLSSALNWQETFWRENWVGRETPPTGNMVLTGSAVMAWFEELGITPGDGTSSNEGPMDILTVADQFDVSVTWDRMLTPSFAAGRLLGSPGETAASVARSVFYPYLVQANPATGPVVHTNATSSTRNGDELIISGEGNGEYEMPILQSWVTYRYRFNELASSFWGTNYTTATGDLPYWSASSHPDDDGINEPYKSGGFLPDINPSEVVPAYAAKNGYSSLFATGYDETISALDTGTLLWMEVLHGSSRAGEGGLSFWAPSNKEPNPWRTYETGGSTEDPDTITTNLTTGRDTQRVDEHHLPDGLMLALDENGKHGRSYRGNKVAKDLGRLRSAGIFAGSCSIANTLLHMELIRHGSVFQVIDPWTTSWYVDYASEIFARELLSGETVGKAYADAVHQVGIGYTTENWWWDAYENLVLYGDPRLKLIAPGDGGISSKFPATVGNRNLQLLHPDLTITDWVIENGTLSVIVENQGGMHSDGGEVITVTDTGEYHSILQALAPGEVWNWTYDIGKIENLLVMLVPDRPEINSAGHRVEWTSSHSDSLVDLSIGMIGKLMTIDGWELKVAVRSRGFMGQATLEVHEWERYPEPGVDLDGGNSSRTREMHLVFEERSEVVVLTLRVPDRPELVVLNITEADDIPANNVKVVDLRVPRLTSSRAAIEPVGPKGSDGRSAADYSFTVWVNSTWMYRLEMVLEVNGEIERYTVMLDDGQNRIRINFTALAPALVRFRLSHNDTEVLYREMTLEAVPSDAEEEGDIPAFQLLFVLISMTVMSMVRRRRF